MNDLKNILLRISFVSGVEIEEMEVMPDHVHLLISFKPKHAPTDIVKKFKGASARMFFAQHPEIKKHKLWGGKLWSNSYFMSTLGNMSRDTVRKYIQNQYVKKEEPNSTHG